MNDDLKTIIAGAALVVAVLAAFVLVAVVIFAFWGAILGVLGGAAYLVAKFFVGLMP